MHPSADGLGNLSKGLGPVRVVEERLQPGPWRSRLTACMPGCGRRRSCEGKGLHRFRRVSGKPRRVRSLFAGSACVPRITFKATLKRDVLAEAQHWMNPTGLEVVFIAEGLGRGSVVQRELGDRSLTVSLEGNLYVVLAETLFLARKFSRFAWPQGAKAHQKRVG